MLGVIFIRTRKGQYIFLKYIYIPRNVIKVSTYLLVPQLLLGPVHVEQWLYLGVEPPPGPLPYGHKLSDVPLDARHCDVLKL